MSYIPCVPVVDEGSRDWGHLTSPIELSPLTSVTSRTSCEQGKFDKIS